MKEKPSVFRALFEKYREIIMYCIFGIATTLVSWLVYGLCERLLPPIHAGSGAFVSWIVTLFGGGTDADAFLSMTLAGVISWIIAVSFAFVTNKLWVFESRSWEGALVRTEALTFFGGRLATGILEIFAVPALVGWGFDLTLFGVNGLPAKILVSLLIVVLNYILSKFLSFRGGETRAEE